MRTRAHIALTLVVTSLASACHILGDCESDRIEVTFPATVQFLDGTQSWDFSGRVYTSNVEVYPALVEAIVEGSRSTAGLVWSLDATSGERWGSLSLWLGPDVIEDQVIPAGFVFDGGGWGFLSASPVFGIAVQVDNFTAATVAGTLTVLSVAPLSLDVDLELSDELGDTVSIQGYMTFQRVRESVSCD